MPKFKEGDMVKIVRLLDEITSRSLIGKTGTVREIEPLPNGEFNYYVDTHYMHEDELELSARIIEEDE
ncbi:hypothetical protein ES703_109012 [subsurface metagenome]